MDNEIPEIFSRCSQLIAARREAPTEDLTSVLVHAEIDGSKLEEHEIVMGFFLLMAAGNDSTKATYSSGVRALMENPEQRERLLADRGLVPGAVEEALRMFPAFAHSGARPPAIPNWPARRSGPATRSSCGTWPRAGMRPATRTPTAST